MAIQRLRVDLLLNSESFNKGLKTAEGRLKAFGSKMTSVGKSLSTRITLPLALAGGAAIKMASDFEESVNKVEVAFKGANGVVKDFAKTTLKQFGIAEGTALDMAALFGDMSTSMGLSVDSAAELSTSLVGLAGDLSSFKNMNIEQVTTALNGVFTGETESLKRLGIVMTQVNLEQFAMEQGITKSLKQMSQAEKVMLRYEFVMSKTKNAQGDFARTSEGAANQMRIFGESSKQLGQKLGSILLPFFTKLVAKGNDLIERFLNLDKKTQELVVAFGVVAAALPPLVLAIGLVATAFGKVTAAVRILTIAMANNPLTALATAVITLTIAFNEALHKINPLVSRTRTFFNIIKSGGNPLKFFELQALANADALKEQEKNQRSLNEENKRIKNILNLGTSLNNPNQPSNTKRTASGLNTSLKPMGLMNTGPIAIQPINLQPVVQGGQKLTKKAIEFMTISNDIINNGMTNIVMDMAAGLGRALATGAPVAESLFFVMLSGIGKVMNELGRLMVVTGIATEKFKKALKTLAGPAMVVAGLALIAGAAALNVMAQKRSSSIASFAKGGIVSGPTLALVGDNTGAGRGNPEVIAPLNKLQGMIDAKSNQQINVGGEFRLEGQDLVLALQRAGRERNRIN